MDDFVYIGVKPCGHVAAIVIDDPAHRKDTATAVKKWIKQGFAIERAERKAGIARMQENCEHGELVEQLKAVK